MNTYKLSSEKVDSLLVDFKGSITKEFTLANIALKNNSLTDPSNAAHTIKGALLNIGNSDWAEIAKRIELEAKNEATIDYSALLKSLKEGIAPLIK